MAFPVDWGRKCALVIQSSEVDANLSDFPVLLTVDNLPSEMFDEDGSSPAISGGGDIRFSSDSLGATQLPCEVVTFTIDNDPANGVAEIWVKVSSVTSGTDTTIYVWYDKAAETQPAIDNAYGAENVWDSNFKMVQHMNQDPSGAAPQMIDSTVNSNDGTSAGTMLTEDQVAGQIGGSLDFDGVDDYVNVPLDLDLDTQNQTVSMWINIADITHNSYFSFAITSVGNDYWGLSYRADKNGLILQYDTNWLASGKFTTPSQNILANTWIYFVFVRGGGINVKLYQDTVKITDEDLQSTDFNPDNIQIGRLEAGTGNYFNGLIDEVRISNIARSIEWLAAEYNNQNDPSTFVVEGTPEAGSSGINLLDGKVAIQSDATDLLDGKVVIQSSALNLLDGKIVVDVFVENLLDGKVVIRGDTLNLLDGKVVIQDNALNLLDGKVVVDQSALNLLDGKVVVFETKHTEVDSGVEGKGLSDVLSGAIGRHSPTTLSGIRGLSPGLLISSLSGIKGVKTEESDIESGVKGTAELGASSGVAGLASMLRLSGIIGGEADIFGFSYPLAEPIPLRNTTIWGSFKNVQTIPHVYGRVRLGPIPYDSAGKFFVLADHSIQGVDEVQVDGEVIYSWKFKNTLDSSDSPVAMLELGEALVSGSSLVALVRGKVHSVTGVLFTNPADVLWDILANIVGTPITYSDLDRFRVECATYGIEIGGILDDRTRSIKAQLDMITESIGAIWSGGMPGLARIYPVKE